MQIIEKDYVSVLFFKIPYKLIYRKRYYNQISLEKAKKLKKDKVSIKKQDGNYYELFKIEEVPFETRISIINALLTKPMMIKYKKNGKEALSKLDYTIKEHINWLWENKLYNGVKKSIKNQDKDIVSPVLDAFASYYFAGYENKDDYIICNPKKWERYKQYRVSLEELEKIQNGTKKDNGIVYKKRNSNIEIISKAGKWIEVNTSNEFIYKNKKYIISNKLEQYQKRILLNGKINVSKDKIEKEISKFKSIKPDVKIDGVNGIIDYFYPMWKIYCCDDGTYFDQNRKKIDEKYISKI